MVYEGDIPVPPGMGGGRVRTRLTFFRQPDGSVRQYSERTRDGGKTWVSARLKAEATNGSLSIRLQADGQIESAL